MVESHKDRELIAAKFKSLSRQRKADAIAAISIALALPAYYKVKFVLEGHMTLEQLWQISVFVEILYAFLLAVILLSLYRLGAKLLQTTNQKWVRQSWPVLLLILSAGVAIIFTRFFYTYIAPWGTNSSFEFDVALLALLLPLIVSGISDRILLTGQANEAALRATKAEMTAIQARFEALKARISPHYLFNSLNTLADIIEEDQKLAVQFVEEMANMYRYILEHKEDKTVPLQLEINAVNSSLFLLHARNPDALIIEFNFSRECQKLRTVPMALQTLVENALKHNQYNKAQPMTLSLYDEDTDLVVENTWNKRIDQSSVGSGLDSLRRQFELVSDRPIKVIKNGDTFMVRLPLL